MKRIAIKGSYSPYPSGSYLYPPSYSINTPVNIGDKEFNKKKHGFRLVYSEGFSEEYFFDRFNSGILDHFARRSKGYCQFCVFGISISGNYLEISYCKGSMRYHQTITCGKYHLGMKLVFEAPYKDGSSVCKCEINYEEDPIFGNVIRIWEYNGEAVNIITFLEDGRFVAVTNDEVTAKIWNEREKEDIRFALKWVDSEEEDDEPFADLSDDDDMQPELWDDDDTDYDDIQPISLDDDN